MTEQETGVLRPEEMVPYVREYLGLQEDLRVLKAEEKRCLAEYQKQRGTIRAKLNPLSERFNQVEETIKKTILHKKLPGIKYKQVVFTLGKKAQYKRPEEKIAEALERNPIEHFAHDRKGLARLLAQAVKKKCKQPPSHNDPANTVLLIRELV